MPYQRPSSLPAGLAGLFGGLGQGLQGLIALKLAQQEKQSKAADTMAAMLQKAGVTMSPDAAAQAMTVPNAPITTPAPGVQGAPSSTLQTPLGPMAQLGPQAPPSQYGGVLFGGGKPSLFQDIMRAAQQSHGSPVALQDYQGLYTPPGSELAGLFAMQRAMLPYTQGPTPAQKATNQTRVDVASLTQQGANARAVDIVVGPHGEVQRVPKPMGAGAGETVPGVQGVPPGSGGNPNPEFDRTLTAFNADPRVKAANPTIDAYQRINNLLKENAAIGMPELLASFSQLHIPNNARAVSVIMRPLLQTGLFKGPLTGMQNLEQLFAKFTNANGEIYLPDAAKQGIRDLVQSIMQDRLGEFDTARAQYGDQLRAKHIPFEPSLLPDFFANVRQDFGPKKTGNAIIDAILNKKP